MTYFLFWEKNDLKACSGGRVVFILCEQMVREGFSEEVMFKLKPVGF